MSKNIKLIIFILTLGLLTVLSVKLENNWIFACCTREDCPVSTEWWTYSCSGANCPTYEGVCKWTATDPNDFCTAWTSWGSCDWDINACYQERYCIAGSTIYQTRQCTCSGYCGDGTCVSSEGEDCDSCSSDCGSCCNASCSTNCGQDDGCGGTCGSTDAGIPTAPVLSPVDGGTVTVTSASPNVRASWSAPSKADSYELELYPAGTNCVTSGAYCNPPSEPILTSLFYSYLPQYPSYYYRVRALNSTCSTEYSTWASATFNVRGTISGQVKQDDNGEAVLVGGVCQLVGASGIQPGAGSVVTVDGVDSGAVGATGLYTLNTALGSSKIAVLTPGDPGQWSCTCPVNCTYSTSAPISGLDFFVSNMKPAWWQVDSGNVHVENTVSSNIPDSAVEPYLITGETGLVSYGVAGDFGTGTINESGDVWQAQTSYQGLVTGYAYFDRILQDDPQDFYVFNGGKPGEGNGVYAYIGDISTSGSWSVTSGEIYVILVDGNVTVTENINVDLGGFLAIITSGNIGIADSVTILEGVYLADGIIDSGTGASPLVGEGIFTGWTGFTLGRDFGDNTNNTTPVEKFIYRPDLVSNAYSFLLKPRMTWTEVAP